MKKRLLALLMSTLLIMTLVATGVAGAAEGKPIRIGVFSNLTGGAAIEGEMIMNGAELARKLANDAGGINGRPVEFIVYDDASTPEGAVKAVTRMIESDNVDAIIGGNLSNNIIAVAPIIEEAGIPFVGHGTAVSWTNAGYKYIFRGTAVSTAIHEACVTSMVEMGEKPAAILYVQSEQGQVGYDDITGRLQNHDIELIWEGTFQAGDTDFTGQCSNLINSKADGIILFGIANDLALALQQLRRMGYEGYIYMAEAAATKDMIIVAGEDANGIIFSAAYVIPDEIEDATNDAQKAMLTAYVEEYGTMPLSDTAFRAFDGTNLMLEAFRTASDMDDPEAVTDAFRAIKGYEGLGGTFDFTDGSGDGLAVASQLMVVDGKYHAFDKELLYQEYGEY